MKNKKNLFIALGAGVAAGAAAFAYFTKNKKSKVRDEYLLTSDSEDEIYFNYAENTEIDAKEAEKKATEAAQKKLGKGAVVVSASDNKALTVNIGGSRRHCFMFGAVADNLSVNPETLLFYVDASTGEVFESND
ncbi:MAG: hypothetical protein IKT39_02065 [Clostridia bacterium]|nr:hypothetical protein [Clostridia bacterium]